MKIVLLAINAKYIHTSLSVRELRGYAKNHGVECEIAEYTINNHLEEIFRGIYEKRPDLLGISCYIWNIELVEKLCNLMKKVLPDTRIFLGGPEVSYRPDEVLRKINADFVISGQGENAMLSLVNVLENGGEDFSKCPSLTYMAGEEIVVNPIGEPVDMSQIAFGYDDFSEVENKICYYEAQRGCPFKCQYCISSVERGVHFAPIEKVRSELGVFLAHKVRQVKFVDRTFNCNEKFAAEIVRFLIENDNGVTNFHFEVAAELLTDGFMELLQSARKGLFQLEIGVQSTNEHTLEAIQRKNDFEYLKYCVGRLKSSENIHLHLDLIAGLPGEDLASFKNSFNMVHSLFPHQLQLGFLKILRGAGMEKMCDEYEILYSPYPPYEVISTSVLTFDEVLYLKDVEDMCEIFYNSNRFSNMIKLLLEGYRGDYFAFYADLAEFFKSDFDELFLKNKNNAYVFLIAFAVKNGIGKKLAIATAKLDFILHERPRSNPSWANDCPNLINREQSLQIIAQHFGLSDDKNKLKELSGRVHVEKFGCDTLFEGEKIFLIEYSDRDLLGNGFVFDVSDFDFRQSTL